MECVNKLLNGPYLLGFHSEQQELNIVAMATVHSFKTLGINNLVTQHNNPEDLNYKQHCRTLKFLISLKNSLNIRYQDISFSGSLMCMRQYQQTLHTVFSTPQIQCIKRQERAMISTQTIFTAGCLCNSWLVTEVCNIDFYHNSNKMLLSSQDEYFKHSHYCLQ